MKAKQILAGKIRSFQKLPDIFYSKCFARLVALGVIAPKKTHDLQVPSWQLAI